MSADVPFVPPWERPLRMPPDLELTHPTPAYASVGEIGSWAVPLVLARDVAGSADLVLQVFGGRNNKGRLMLQVEDPAQDGYLSVSGPDGLPLAVRTMEKAGSFAVRAPAAGLRRGSRVTAVLGDRSGGGRGVAAPPERLLNKFIVLYDTASSAAGGQTPPWAGGSVWVPDAWPSVLAAATMHILGGPASVIRAHAPAQARPGVPFRILIRPEGARGVLSMCAPGPVRILLGDEELRADVEAVEQSTCLAARVCVTREGTWRLRVVEERTGLEALTNPVVVRAASDRVAPYWGMIHGHTEMSDGTGRLDQYFRQMRDECVLDFAATGDHDHLWETPDDYWALTCAAVKAWHQPGSFVTLAGYEWAKWRRNGDGDRNVYYLRDDRPMYRSDDGHRARPPDLFAALRAAGEAAIVIPHHTGHSGNFCDWKDHSPEHERLVEIFQVRGSYECAEEEGNPAPEKAPAAPYAGGFIRRALAAGWRVGFTAGGDDHDGQWGTEFRFASGARLYKQGLMGVFARGLSREALWEALYARRVVATTGARILFDYDMDGAPMGSETRLGDRPGLRRARPFAFRFHGTAPLHRLDLVRNGSVVHSIAGEGRCDLECAWTDGEDLEGLWLPPAAHCPRPFCYYYARAVQADGEVAWASPVWIDP